MSEDLEDIASVAEQQLEMIHKYYEFENNPIWAWLAYQRARTWGIPIPEWVLIYLDDASQKLWGAHSRSVREALAVVRFTPPRASGRKVPWHEASCRSAI